MEIFVTKDYRNLALGVRYRKKIVNIQTGFKINIQSLLNVKNEIFLNWSDPVEKWRNLFHESSK